MKLWKKQAAALFLAAATAAAFTGMTAAAGWQNTAEGWKFENGGSYRTEQWVKSGNAWYYLNNQGIMATGWLQLGQDWYWCGADGVMCTGWQDIGQNTYFFNADGVMQTGMIQIDGVDVLFAESGEKTGQTPAGYAKAAYTSAGAPAELVLPVKDGTTVRVTIPEGKNAGEIGAILEANGVCRRADFLKALNQYQTQSETFDGFKGNDRLFYRYEGCLFPDTYEFYRYDDPQNIIRRMLINFDGKFTEEMKARMEKAGLTLEETITLASMVQEEAAKPEDMRKVAAVFFNRLKQSKRFPKLQSDPTTAYMRDQILPERDLGNAAAQPESYDTYQCEGLPAGPICNPGLEAIQAVLSPEKGFTQYFFCTDRQGNFYYARTNAQHEKNLAAVKKANAENAESEK